VESGVYMSGELLWNVGAALVFAGFVLSLIAVVLLLFSSLRGKKVGGKVRGGGVVVIGPFPIVFGTDKESAKILLLLSIALIALLLVFMAFSHYVLG